MTDHFEVVDGMIVGIIPKDTKVDCLGFELHGDHIDDYIDPFINHTIPEPKNKSERVFNIVEVLRDRYHPQHGLVEHLRKSMMNMNADAIDSLAFLLNIFRRKNKECLSCIYCDEDKFDGCEDHHLYDRDCSECVEWHLQSHNDRDCPECVEAVNDQS